MCDILTIGGALAAAGGAAANYSAQSSVDGARQRVVQDERTRQQALQAEADTVNAGARDRYKTFNADTDAKAASLGDMFRTAPNTGPQLMPASTSNVTVTEQGKQKAKFGALADQQAVAQGKARAFGDVLGTVSRAQARDAGTVGQIGGFETGSSNVVPYELDNAGHAGDGMKFFGDLLGAGGKLGITAGLSGGTVGNPFKTAAVAAPNVFASGAKPVSNPFNLYG